MPRLEVLLIEYLHRDALECLVNELSSVLGLMATSRRAVLAAHLGILAFTEGDPILKVNIKDFHASLRM